MTNAQFPADKHMLISYVDPLDPKPDLKFIFIPIMQYYDMT
jgi:hypothetical protein